MKMIINRSLLKFIAFILSCLLSVISFAQNKGLDISYSAQQPPTFNINFQKIDLVPKPEFFPASNWNLKSQKVDLADNFLPVQSNIPPLRNEHSRIWKKVGRAELIIGGTELIGMTVLILLPKEVTGWSQNWVQDAWHNMKQSFSSPPVWDKDDWQLNYIGHPVAGSYYYNSLRSQNASIFHSFLFATAQSFFWEYVIEATAEKPSIQDLVVTPIAGAILGESTHLLTMNMRRNGFNFFEKIFVIVFNPMFVINNGFGPRFNPVRNKALLEAFYFQ